MDAAQFAGKAIASPADVDVVVFHAPCPDGTAAALALYAAGATAAAYVGVDTSAAAKAAATLGVDVRGKRVLVLDYTFTAAAAAELLRSAAALLFIDHHVSATRDLAALPAANAVFNMGHSGATLAWGFCHAAASAARPEPPPPLLRYVEDGDLWRRALPGADAFGLGLPPPLPVGVVADAAAAFAPWLALLAAGDAGVAGVVRRGAPLVAARDDFIRAEVPRSVRCRIVGFPHLTAAMLNTTAHPMWRSSLGDALLLDTGADLVLMWSAVRRGAERGDAEYWVSMRARRGVDSSVVAAAFGGGGHAGASGFTWPRPLTDGVVEL
jgi:hypothetical protein